MIDNTLGYARPVRMILSPYRFHREAKSITFPKGLVSATSNNSTLASFSSKLIFGSYSSSSKQVMPSFAEKVEHDALAWKTCMEFFRLNSPVEFLRLSTGTFRKHVVSKQKRSTTFQEPTRFL